MTTVDKEDDKIPPQTQKIGADGVDDDKSIDLHGTRNQMKYNKKAEQEKYATGTAGLHGNNAGVPTVSNDSAIRQPTKNKTQENAFHTLSQTDTFHPQHDGTLSREEVSLSINMKRRALPPNEHSDKREDKREKQKENTIQEANTVYIIDKEVDIFLLNKKDDRIPVINVVLKYISAYLNTHGGVVKLKNHHWKDTIGKNLDLWYKVLEEKLFDESSKYITREGEYNDEIILLHIKPLHRPFTVNMYLYFPRTTEVIEAKYTQAIGILCSNDKPGSLSELPLVKGDFVHNRALPNLSENDQIQFKDRRSLESKSSSKIDKSKSLLSKFSSKIDRYISAFSNHKGGRIFFGIEDKKFKVVGVKLTKEDKASIRALMHSKMNSTMKRACDNRTYEYGEHWSLDFFPVKHITEAIPDGTCLEVIMVSVCRYPGGVFTETPKAYYIREEDRTIQQFTFKEWKTRMISSDKDKPIPIAICNVDMGNIVSYYIETQTLKDLKKELTSTNQVFIKGIKGTGKSQLALKYAQEQKEQSINHIVWKMKCQDTCFLQRALEFLHRSLGCIMTNPNFTDICQAYGHSIVTKLTTLCQRHSDLSPLLLLDDVTEITLKNVRVFLNQLQQCTSIKVIATTEVLPDFSARVLEVNGFTEEESCTFLSGNKNQNKSEKELSLELAKKINSNPLGLYIFRTLMYQQNWSIVRMNEIIQSSYFNLANIESMASHVDGEHRLFGYLRAVLDLVKDNDKEIFKLLSVLQFMDKNEEIPIILLEFYSMQIGLLNDLTVEKFVKKIKDASFGTISGEDDFRLLKTHEVVIFVLELNTNSPSDMQSMLHLLKSFIMVIIHDNRSQKDLKINKLMLPHAIEVVKRAEKLFTTLGDTKDAVEYKTLLMYVNHLIGYILSFTRKSLLAMEYLAKAKQQIFSLFNVELTEWEGRPHTGNCDMSEACKNAHKLLENLDKFKTENKIFHSKFVQWFIVGKRRSEKEKESLYGILHKSILSCRLTQEEYMKLVNKKMALCFDDMQYLLFIELMISVLFTHGRQIFYLDDIQQNDRNCFCQSLQIAYCLSSKIKEVNPCIYWQRICTRNGILQLMFLDLDQPEKTDEYWQVIKEEFDKRNVEEFKYYRFGILKNDEQLTDKVAWFKLYVNCCIRLYDKTDDDKVKTLIHAQGQDAVNSLVELQGQMKDLTSYHSFLSAIAEWYDCIGKIEKALEYFKQIIPDDWILDKDASICLNKQQEKALAFRIRHLVESLQVPEAEYMLATYRFNIKGEESFENMQKLIPSPSTTVQS